MLHTSIRRGPRAAFTLIEMLTVVAVIVLLVGLVLGANSGIQTKAARVRSEGEISGLSLACENYKVDNGGYPRDEIFTDKLDPRMETTPSKYLSSIQILYAALSGDLDRNGVKDPDSPRSYFEFKPDMLGGERKSGQLVRAVGAVRFIQDPWGNSYGYSTARLKQDEDLQVARNTGAAPMTPGAAAASKGYNSTFDIWSTGGSGGGASSTGKWVKNW